MGLTTSSFWILTVLAAGRRHGYQLMREVDLRSGGAVALKATTLYASLDRLEQDALIEPDGEEIVDGRARRYYRITELGRGRLAAEAGLLENRAAAARETLSADTPAAGAKEVPT